MNRKGNMNIVSIRRQLDAQDNYINLIKIGVFKHNINEAINIRYKYLALYLLAHSSYERKRIIHI